MEQPRTATSPVAAAVKRGLDVTMTLAALLVAAPIMAAVAVAVLLTMGRPVIFRQQRIGWRGREFTLLKFRSMAGGSNIFAPSGDHARLTPLGRWLRATSLDELPSLWNVVRGDMSLVGPRPLVTAYRDLYTPEQFRRHDVRPGLTGLAQVSGRNALTWEQRFGYDVRYVDSWSLLLDARILVRTVVAVLARRGISAPGTVTAHEFRGSAPDRSPSLPTPTGSGAR
ncbi:sugar transferase [Micromonospora sp. NBS 11-29]|uniref:sugar transferase n=1 Tax=Micromonospora sp. NBS 11-29 TaxID=1960879 RepID=UPI0020CF6455|nr:sugar transferase [Micromonospora sp. NBS 11-29]